MHKFVFVKYHMEKRGNYWEFHFLYCIFQPSLTLLCMLPPGGCILSILKHHHEAAPEYFRICSKESQNVSDHGAIRSQHGRKPLYRPKKPSFLSVFFKQSSEPLYKSP